MPNTGRHTSPDYPPPLDAGQREAHPLGPWPSGTLGRGPVRRFPASLGVGVGLGYAILRMTTNHPDEECDDRGNMPDKA